MGPIAGKSEVICVVHGVVRRAGDPLGFGPLPPRWGRDPSGNCLFLPECVQLELSQHGAETNLGDSDESK